MKRIIPNDIYREWPCSVVALGCAMGVTQKSDLKALKSPDLKADGYLSLNGMNKLIRANMSVLKRVDYRRGERPILREFAHADGEGKKAVICVAGHYIYFDGRDYHSFFFNGGDDVIAVWYVV
jgi:hypothetical protein